MLSLLDGPREESVFAYVLRRRLKQAPRSVFEVFPLSIFESEPAIFGDVVLPLAVVQFFNCQQLSFVARHVVERVDQRQVGEVFVHNGRVVLRPLRPRVFL